MIFEGQVINGFSLSVTVTVNDAANLFNDASVAVYVTVVIPVGNTDPEAGPAVWAMMLPEQLSAEVGAVQLINAPQTPASLFTAMLPESPTIVGFCVSFTFTVNEAVNLFDTASVAVYVIVVLPIGNTVPEAGPAVCDILLPEQLSAEVGAVQLTNAPQTSASLLTSMLAGRSTILGFSLSVTVTV